MRGLGVPQVAKCGLATSAHIRGFFFLARAMRAGGSSRRCPGICPGSGRKVRVGQIREKMRCFQAALSFQPSSVLLRAMRAGSLGRCALALFKRPAAASQEQWVPRRQFHVHSWAHRSGVCPKWARPNCLGPLHTRPIAAAQVLAWPQARRRAHRHVSIPSFGRPDPREKKSGIFSFCYPWFSRFSPVASSVFATCILSF